MDLITLALAKRYTDKKIATSGSQLQFKKVFELPEKGEAGIIYLLKKNNNSSQDNVYIEYIWSDDAWESIGDTSINIPEQVQADWNQDDETDASFIKNKPENATDDDAMVLLAELNVVSPLTISDGSIITSSTGKIYSL